MVAIKDGFKFIENNLFDTLILDGDNIARCLDYLNERDISKLSILSTYYKGTDLEFLNDCKHILELDIDTERITDLAGIYKLSQLKVLSFTELKFDFDLSPFKELQAFAAIYNNKLKNLVTLKQLKHLELTKFKSTNGDLGELIELNNLESLRLTQASISSLKGSKVFTKMKKLELYYLRRLSILDELPENLETLYLESCSRLENHQFIAKLKKLEHLKLTKCGEIKSLDFVQNLPHLSSISFIDTNILGGDLSPCIGLNYVGFIDKKHYSHKFEELNPSKY